MNYERALATLRHARTGKQLDKKKLCNETWLHRILDKPDEGESRWYVDLVLFDKPIATWKPNGNVELISHGHHATTKERYNRFLHPYRVWQTRPYWYIRTPAGILPFRDEMELTADGRDLGRAPALNAIDAIELKEQVHKYALLYANRLANGIIPTETECEGCRKLPWQFDSEPLGEELIVHLLHHIQRDCTPCSIIRAAVNRAGTFSSGFCEGGRTISRSWMQQVIETSWTESQRFWRKPRTKSALLEQTELLMTAENTPRRDLRPREYVVNFRLLVEDFLLETFGFERMEDA